MVNRICVYRVQTRKIEDYNLGLVQNYYVKDFVYNAIKVTENENVSD